MPRRLQESLISNEQSRLNNGGVSYWLGQSENGDQQTSFMKPGVGKAEKRTDEKHMSAHRCSGWTADRKLRSGWPLPQLIP